jgi:hypothetical protein
MPPEKDIVIIPPRAGEVNSRARFLPKNIARRRSRTVYAGVIEEAAPREVKGLFPLIRRKGRARDLQGTFVASL